MAPDSLPAAAALALAALTARGARLTMPGPGRLAVLPADAASPDDLEALRAARPWLLSTWQAAAAWDADNSPRPAADPLPPAADACDDDGQDADAWAAALALAAAADGADPFGLTGRLRFARSMGARLRWTDAGALAVRMPAGSPDAAVVADALEGQGPALRRLLDQAATTARPVDHCQPGAARAAFNAATTARPVTVAA